MNNIFKYATGELSQDAFICWFFNWFNEGNNLRLKQLVCDFCKEKLDVQNLSSVDIHRQFSSKVEREKEKFSVKIDVLVILNKKIAVIIEDKTFTSEHDDQILRYEKGLKILQSQDKEKKLRIESNAYSITTVMSVYWKTGFFYDCDKRIKADKVIKTKDLIDLLENYRDESQIIDMFVQNLLDNEQWYETHKKYWEIANKNEDAGKWNTNLCRNQIAQYTMMKEIFPENRDKLYFVDHGSSFGRPWTETWIYNNYRTCSEQGKESFEIFWRIDTDNDGSYISLRLYKYIKGKWDNRYNELKTYAQEYIEEEGSYSWQDLDPGTKNSYKEADIVHFKINKASWEKDNGQHLIEVVRGLTEKILCFAKTAYGPNDYEIVE